MILLAPGNYLGKFKVVDWTIRAKKCTFGGLIWVGLGEYGSLMVVELK